MPGRGQSWGTSRSTACSGSDAASPPVVADGPPERLRDPQVWLRAFGVASSEQLLGARGALMQTLRELLVDLWQLVFMRRAFLVALTASTVGIGGFSAVAGLYLSLHLRLAAGGLIVMVATVAFLLCWVFAPTHGWLAKRARVPAPRRTDLPERTEHEPTMA